MKLNGLAIITLLTGLGTTAFCADQPVFQSDQIEQSGGVTRLTGHVSVRSLGVVIQADSAIYDPAAETVTLDGEVKLEDAKAKSTLTAVHVVYFLNGGRVKTVGPCKVTVEASAR